MRKPLDPTIASPTTAKPHPIQCLFSIIIPNKIFEKIAVVTILAPLNIRYVDPAIRFKPMY